MADDKRLERIETKVDKITEHIGSIDLTLVKQSVILEEHVKRTNILENKVIPIEEHVQHVKGAIKFIKIVGVITAIIEALRLFK